MQQNVNASNYDVTEEQDDSMSESDYDDENDSQNDQQIPQNQNNFRQTHQPAQVPHSSRPTYGVKEPVSCSVKNTYPSQSKYADYDDENSESEHSSDYSIEQPPNHQTHQSHQHANHAQNTETKSFNEGSSHSKMDIHINRSNQSPNQSPNQGENRDITENDDSFRSPSHHQNQPSQNA